MECFKIKSNPISEQLFIDNLIGELYASYADGNAINHTDGNNLPRESEILAILHDLLELVYPGFQERAHYSASNLRYSVGEILSRCYAGLKDSISRSLRYSCRITEGEKCSCNCGELAEEAARYLLSSLPSIRDTLKLDIAAAYEGDPAAKSNAEIVMSYPGLRAITIQRIAHCLYERNIPLIPRMMGEYAHRITGIDIHPGARLGKSIFIDHGTGVVIGETSVIGSNVKIYQGVTIGALSFPKDSSGKIIKGNKRHPTIEDDVTIYAGATILGPITVGHSSIIGGNAWITDDVEPYTKITISPPTQTVRKSSRAAVPAKMKKAMLHTAGSVLKDSLCVKKKESVLLIFDRTTEEIAQAFQEAASAMGLSLKARKTEITSGNGADPDAETCQMMKTSDVIIGATCNSLTHSHAMTVARNVGSRAATLPGITCELFARSVPKDPQGMKKDGEKWLSLLKGVHTFELETDAGTKLTFEAGKLPFESDDGFFSATGMVGNIPSGEVFAPPFRMNGVLVVDGSIAGFPWTEESPSCRIVIRDNKAVKFEGERAEELKKALLTAGKKGLLVAEFGIGMNPGLHLSGNLLEDEKVRGTVHIAFGNNAGMGGDNDVPVHIDCLVQAPTLKVDGRLCMKKGIWKLK